MSAETADVLDRAADVIRRRGWRQGPRAEGQRSVDAWDALVAVACKAPRATTNAALQRLAPAGRALMRFLDVDSIITPSAWTIPDWNDAPERTAEQVIAALEGAARAEREATS